MILSYEEKQKTMEQLKKEKEEIKKRIKKATNERRKKALEEVYKNKDELEEDLFFSPTLEDIEEMKYWL